MENLIQGAKKLGEGLENVMIVERNISDDFAHSILHEGWEHCSLTNGPITHSLEECGLFGLLHKNVMIIRLLTNSRDHQALTTFRNSQHVRKLH